VGTAIVALCRGGDPVLTVVASTEGRRRVLWRRRRFSWAFAGGIVLPAAAFAWMVTGATFQFFRSTSFSNFYGVQTRLLLCLLAIV
jgi:hypothetical protein